MFINYIKIELNIYLNDDKGVEMGSVCLFSVKMDGDRLQWIV